MKPVRTNQFISKRVLFLLSWRSCRHLCKLSTSRRSAWRKICSNRRRRWVKPVISRLGRVHFTVYLSCDAMSSSFYISQATNIQSLLQAAQQQLQQENQRTADLEKNNQEMQVQLEQQVSSVEPPSHTVPVLTRCLKVHLDWQIT